MEAAEASGILKIVDNKLAPLLMKEYSSIVGTNKNLQQLHGQVVEINIWLESVGDKAVGNDPSFNLHKELKDIAYEVHDIVDEFQLKAEKHETSGDGSIVSKYLWNKPKSIIFQCKVATKIKAIRKKFDAVVKQRKDFITITNSLLVGHPVRHKNMTVGEISSLPFIDTASVLGRDKDKENLIFKLVEVKDQQTINIVSIIGLGGSGKTTLAKLVYNDGNIIDKHFEVKLWVHVSSQEFDVVKLIGKLFEAIAGEESEQYPLQQMSKTISDKLTKKRYLLVLDDVWTKDQTLWDQFMVHLKSGTPGSAILLTMRSSDVAGTVRSTYQFNLPFLSLDDSWQLFQQSLGMPVRHLEESEFVEVGKEIVKKCSGVPLAIKVIAGFLRGKELIGEWLVVRESNLLDVEGEETMVYQCLRLSYSHLSSHMKQCFTMCSVFPKGYMIDKENLIELWIAHDMITQAAGVEYLEYIGHKYFDTLVNVSFLQDVVRNHRGRVSCSMPNLVHDFALRILGEDISLVVPMEPTTFAKSYRYFSFPTESINSLPDNLFEKTHAIYVATSGDIKFGKALQNAKHLRSIIVEYAHTKSVSTTIFQVKSLKYLEISRLKCEALPEYISEIWSLQALHVTYSDLLNIPKSIGKLQKLRTLNLSWCKRLKSLPGSVGDCCMISTIDLSGCSGFEELPNSIGSNKGLRIIRISNTKIERIPSSITLLGNLESLDLQWCHDLVELPEGFDNLKKLQVLNLDGCKKLRAMPVGIGQLSQLQNLSTFVVGKVEKSAKISELGNINRISGELTIKGIECVTSPDDAQNACLKQKTNLQSLQLHWGRNDAHKERNVEDILDGLEPSSGIQELYIVGYTGMRYAQWMLNQVVHGVQEHRQFPSLTVMTLCGFQKLNNLEGLMELPCLEELKLQWMPLLTSISGGPFPKLVKLRMEGLPSLGEVRIADGTLADGDGDGDGRRINIGERLTNLHIEECPKLMLKWSFPSSIEHLVLKRSNDQLLLLPGQGQGEGPSSSSSFPPSCSFDQLKELELWGMAASSSSPPPLPGSGSKHAWEILQHMTALESLKICQCGGLTKLPDSMRSLTSLRSLFINFCSSISKLPEWLGELCSLRNMTIQSCHSLSDLQSIGHLVSLQELRIECCDKLHELPICLGELCSLQKLIIQSCHTLRDLQIIGHLASLQELRIERCHELQYLPECLGELYSLRRFDIASLQGLTFLPKSMCRLTSLEELEISDCQGLTSLPEWIQGLPALQKLKIARCPDLERRCEREKGEDRHLINHIPHLQIGLDEGEPVF